MLGLTIRNLRVRRCLTIACLGAAAALSSCATKPTQTALVSDPDATVGSAIPWNHPASWEGTAGVPGAPQGSDPSFGNGSGYHR
ncbi:MAG TPA: hypothetical protein VHW03_04710 [Chthoniobacterales bacterium]|jgi:hypothetical protein|nr:hypothetical protein [Chthoniobacterales bacterium]